MSQPALTHLRIGILGLGTVGGGTASLLHRNRVEITRRTGVEVSVVMASVRDLHARRDCDTSGFELVTDPWLIVNSDQVDIVVELIGGETLAKQLIEAAIDNGKHIVTANKALLAIHGNELFAKARANGVNILFEAAVAGGISIIKSLREGLAANQIKFIAGIINGTSNFILTRMRDKGESFAEVLQQAQELGYAEADPTFDIEGIDAAHKLTILASLAFGVPLQFEQVYTEGIAELDLIDIDYARELGYQIKHLGYARLHEQQLELRVHPALIPERQLLANVDGVMNAVLVNGDALGNTLLYGAGAGGEPTASAVLADIIDLLRAPPQGFRVPDIGFMPEAIQSYPIKTPEQFRSAWYLRITAIDVPGVMTRLTHVFAELGINLEAIIQKEPARNEPRVTIIFITQRTTETELNSAVSQLEQLEDVNGQITRLRVEHLD